MYNYKNRITDLSRLFRAASEKCWREYEAIISRDPDDCAMEDLHRKLSAAEASCEAYNLCAKALLDPTWEAYIFDRYQLSMPEIYAWAAVPVVFNSTAEVISDAGTETV